MEEIKILIIELIAEKYPEFKISMSQSEIKIFRSTYFYVTLKKYEREFRITTYSGLLAYLLNKKFNKKIVSLKSDLEKIITENNFNFNYVEIKS